MSKLTKRMRSIHDRINHVKQYDIIKAILLLKELTTVNFIESVDAAINLNINTRKSDQNIRGSIVLPHGTGRIIRVAVFAYGTDAEAARIAGADLIGMDNLADQIKKENFNFDIIIASMNAMQIVSQLGHILGPRGLMPNPKMGTLTTNVANAVKNAKSGQVQYRNDRNGIVHSSIGRINFESNKLKENLEALLIALKKAKPIQTKGIFIKKISLSTTMGASLTIDQNSLFNITA